MEELRNLLLNDYSRHDLLEINQNQFNAVFNFIMRCRANWTEQRKFKLTAFRAKTLGISFAKFKNAWPTAWYINDQDDSGIWVLIPDHYFHS